jgi:hypothetical protein
MLGLDRYGIFAKGHRVLGSEYIHLSIRIVPRNPQWQTQYPTRFAHRLGLIGPWFATIGAGSTDGCDGTLVSALNRLADWSLPGFKVEKLRYGPEMEDTIIARFFQRDEAYADNLPYACFPANNPGEYNSNSFAIGLIRASDTPVPGFPWQTPEAWRYVGVDQHVPRGSFVLVP